MAKIAGYIIIILSLFIWAAIFVIPWLGLSGGKIAGLITILIIAGEVTFYLGIALLGKTIYEKIKRKLGFGRKKKDTGLTNDMEGQIS